MGIRKKKRILYVDDLAEACVHLINMDYRGTMLNIGTGIDITIDQLAKKIMSTVGIEVRLVYDKATLMVLLEKYWM